MLYLLWLSRVRHLLGDSFVRLNNTVLGRDHWRDFLIFSVIHWACDTFRALQRSRSLSACSGSSRTVIASLSVSLGLRPAPGLDPPLVSTSTNGLPFHVLSSMAHLAIECFVVFSHLVDVIGGGLNPDFLVRLFLRFP
jgi:hypothetical protein